MSFLWLIITNTLHASVLGRPQKLGLRGVTLQHLCSTLCMVHFLSVSVLGRKEFPIHLPLIADLCFVSVQESGSRTFFSLFPPCRGLFNSILPLVLGTGGLPTLPQKQILFTLSLSHKQVFSWAKVWEGLVPFLQWLKNLSYIRHGSRVMSGNLSHSSSGLQWLSEH